MPQLTMCNGTFLLSSQQFIDLFVICYNCSFSLLSCCFGHLAGQYLVKPSQNPQQPTEKERLQTPDVCIQKRSWYLNMNFVCEL